MTEQKRSRDGGNIWMILLILLALVATAIMLFSDSARWLQVALLASLWAAILGFLLVSRSRKDRDAAERLLDAQAREHEAEIEAYRARERANRSAVEAARASNGLPPVADMEILREIRDELATLRAQLEELSGREFGYEPAALQAEARRVREIEARANDATGRFARVRSEHMQPEPEPMFEPEPMPMPSPSPSSSPSPSASPGAGVEGAHVGRYRRQRRHLPPHTSAGQRG